MLFFWQLHPHKEIVRNLVILKQREKLFAEVPEFSMQVLIIREKKKWERQLVEGLRETPAVPAFPGFSPQ